MVLVLGLVMVMVLMLRRGVAELGLVSWMVALVVIGWWLNVYIDGLHARWKPQC